MIKYIILFLTALFPLWAHAFLSLEAATALNENTPAGNTFQYTPHTLVFTTADGKLVGAVNGNATATMGWDFNNVIDNPNEFAIFEIPVDGTPGNGGQFQLSAQQSALQLNMVAIPDDKNAVGAFFKVTLLGNNYAPWIEYALVNWRGLSAGYGYTLFSDANCALPTIDFKGPCAYTGISNTVVQYRRKLGAGFSTGLGLEMPILSATYNDKTAEVTQRIPDIPAMVCYNYAGGHVRFSALLRNMQYRDKVAAKNRNCMGWGVQLSGANTIMSDLTALWQGAYGCGISSYFQDFTDNGLDLTPCGDGKMNAVKAWGAFVGLQYNISKCLCACVGCSQLKAHPKSYHGGTCLYDNQPSYTQYAVGNITWQVNDFLCWGVEYIYGRRVNISQQQGHASRLQTMLKFSF